MSEKKVAVYLTNENAAYVQKILDERRFSQFINDLLDQKRLFGSPAVQGLTTSIDRQYRQLMSVMDEVLRYAQASYRVADFSAQAMADAVDDESRAALAEKTQSDVKQMIGRSLVEEWYLSKNVKPKQAVPLIDQSMLSSYLSELQARTDEAKVNPGIIPEEQPVVAPSIEEQVIEEPTPVEYEPEHNPQRHLSIDEIMKAGKVKL